MVQSHLNNKILYKKSERLDKNDLNHESSIYEIEINGNNELIVLGKINKSKIDDNILYINVYNIEDESVKEHIGIYELNEIEKENIYDEDDDIDIERLNQILLFDELKLVNDKNDDEDVDDDGDEDVDGEGDEDVGDEGDEDVNGEGDEDVDDEGDEESDSDEEEDDDEKWINKFTNSEDYTIMDNEGGGDCFFAAVRDGLNKVNKNISVEEIRKKLANEATQEILDNYLVLYNSFKDEKESLESNIIKLNTEIEELKNNAKKETNLTNKTDILNNIEDKNNKIIKINNELEIVNQQLNDEFYFMNNVLTLDDFKEVIETSNYWADTWAISTIERILNIKIIILSSQNYKLGDIDNVLLCGQLNDAVLENQKTFNPDYYIILEYTGNHYKLILYKNEGAVGFDGISEFIKNLIKEKCLERKVGPYYLIPEFRNMIKNKLEFEEKNEIEINKSKLTKDEIELDIEDLNTEESNNSKKDNKLYDENIVFQFYSKSSGFPLPGKGSGETIPEENLLDFADLAKIPNWRRKLSNFWVSPFKLDDHEWSSVEHYYQASKFKKNNLDFYLKFTLDKNPDSELSKEPAMAKAAGGKTGKYKGKIIRDKTIKMDDGFIENERFSTMKKAMKAKFTQNKELNTLLKETKPAKLQHYIRGGTPEIFLDLMEVRSEL